MVNIHFLKILVELKMSPSYKYMQYKILWVKKYTSCKNCSNFFSERVLCLPQAENFTCDCENITVPGKFFSLGCVNLHQLVSVCINYSLFTLQLAAILVLITSVYFVL